MLKFQNPILKLFKILCSFKKNIFFLSFVFQNNQLFVKIYLIAFALLIIFTIVILIVFLLRNYSNKMTFIVNTVVYVCEYQFNSSPFPFSLPLTWLISYDFYISTPLNFYLHFWPDCRTVNVNIGFVFYARQEFIIRKMCTFGKISRLSHFMDVDPFYFLHLPIRQSLLIFFTALTAHLLQFQLHYELHRCA